MIVFTGGSGLLGKEMGLLYPEGLFPTHKEMDIDNLGDIEEYLDRFGEVTTLVHAAAYTNTVSCEGSRENRIKAIKTNIIGTSNIVISCMSRGIRLVYISTDYVFSGERGNYREGDEVNPINNYAWTKLGGESAVRVYDKSLIIRTTFCTNEFPYNKAFDDQYTSRTSVREFAKKLRGVIEREDLIGIIHIGGRRRTVYDLAKELSPEKDISPIKREEIKGYRIPRDTSLDTRKYDSLFRESEE